MLVHQGTEPTTGLGGSSLLSVQLLVAGICVGTRLTGALVWAAKHKVRSDMIQGWLRATRWQSPLHVLRLSEAGRMELAGAKILPAIMITGGSDFCNSYQEDSKPTAAVNFEQPQNSIANLWWMFNTYKSIFKIRNWYRASSLLQNYVRMRHKVNISNN